MPLAPGDTVAGYTVVRELGSGGMGSVYLVRHPRLPRLDALKLLRRELCDDPDFARRFLQEADVVARLSHRNIVSVLDRGNDDGQLWLTMQYVEGTDAETALAEAGGILPATRAVHIVAEVAAALDAAHRQQLVHRDVKPANVLLRRNEDGDEPEQVFLTDFGIAKTLDGGTRLTRTGMVLATFDYASPEQIESRPLDARSDVYSLGCVLHKLLTGRVPFPGQSVLAALHGHLGQPPPRPTDRIPWLPPGMDDVVARAMAKDRAARFGTCRELAMAATAALAAMPPPPPPPYRLAVSRGGGPATSTEVRIGTDRLRDLLTRTRFFDLPATVPLADDADGRRTDTVALEVGATGRTHRVTMDLGDPRLPGEFGALVAAAEAPAAAVPSETVVERPVPPPPPPPRPSSQVLPPPRSYTQTGPVEPPPARGPTPVYAAAPTDPGVRGPAPEAPPPQPPWQPPPETPYRPQPPGRRPTSPWVWLAVAVAVFVAAGGTWWFLLRPDGTSGDSGDSGSSSSAAGSESAGGSESPAQAALDALPRGEPLPAGTLVVPRVIDGGLDLHLVDAASGTDNQAITTVPGDDIGPIIAPDRRSVAFARVSDGLTELRVVGSDGSTDSPLFGTPPENCETPRRPAWNPADPAQLALVCAGSGEGGTDRLLLVTLDGAVVRQLDPGHPYVDDVAFSPDGTHLAYWGADQPRVDGGNLFSLPLDGSAPVAQLTTQPPGSDADPIWSPDGGSIAFRRDDGDGGRRLLVMAADGSGQRSLTSAGFFDQDPVWSPDGSQIAFKSDRAGGDTIWVVSSSGGNPRQLPRGASGGDQAPAWGNR